MNFVLERHRLRRVRQEEEPQRNRRVQDDEAHQVLTASGAHVLAGPVPTPVGRNLIAMHPDGSVYEYVDRRAAG